MNRDTAKVKNDAAQPPLVGLQPWSCEGTVNGFSTSLCSPHSGQESQARALRTLADDFFYSTQSAREFLPQRYSAHTDDGK